jgi:hypothetical protein
LARVERSESKRLSRAGRLATASTFTVEGVSKSGNKFRITRTAGGGYTRACDTAGDGGCKTGGTW